MQPDSLPIPTNAMILNVRAFGRPDVKPTAPDKGVPWLRVPATVAETAAQGPQCGIGYSVIAFCLPTRRPVLLMTNCSLTRCFLLSSVE